MRGKKAKVVKDMSSGAPHLVSWNITLRCPLKCSHCYVEAGMDEPAGMLSTEEALAVIDQIREVGTPVVVLSGGEPLMREDLCTIARYGTEQGLRMVMGTSGYFLDRSMAASMRDAGIRAAAVSIDSADPAVHDSFRGVSGAWEKALQGVRNCRDEGIGVQFLLIVSLICTDANRSDFYAPSGRRAEA